MEPASLPTAPAEGPAPARPRAVLAWRSAVEHWRDPLFRNSYFLIANSLVNAGGGFLFWLLAARTADPASVGLATSSVSAMMLISLGARVGFDLALLRFVPPANPAQRRALLATSFGLTGLLALVAAGAFALGASWWSPDLSSLSDLRALPVFAALTAVWTASWILDTYLTALRRSDVVLGKNLLFAVLRVAILLALPVADWRWIAAAAVGPMLVGSVAVAAFLLPRIEPGHRPRAALDAGIVRRTLSTSIPNYAVTLVMNAPSTLGSLLVLRSSGPSAAALFYVLWMVGTIAMIAPSSLGQAALVEISGGGTRVRLLRPLVLSAAAGLVAVAAGLIVLPLLGAHYVVSAWSLAPFALAAVPAAFLQIRLAEYRAAERNAPLVAIPLVAVAVFIAPLAVGAWPVASIGWTWLASMGIAASLAFLVDPRRADA